MYLFLVYMRPRNPKGSRRNFTTEFDSLSLSLFFSFSLFSSLNGYLLHLISPDIVLRLFQNLLPHLDTCISLLISLLTATERLSLVCKERDLAMNDFELQVNECNLMKEKLMEMEKKERRFVDEVGKLTLKYDRLVGEKEEL